LEYKKNVKIILFYSCVYKKRYYICVYKLINTLKKHKMTEFIIRRQGYKIDKIVQCLAAYDRDEYDVVFEYEGITFKAILDYAYDVIKVKQL
tara:strand:- start:51 stop:326 length:276 start_codon:yes stop_codon:yes gene_type:complete